LIGANPVVIIRWRRHGLERRQARDEADSRRLATLELARHATHYLQFADTDVALLNAMMHIIVEEAGRGQLHRRCTSG
jgi:formate dehydrogenase major subunit